jgi:hypothetical protein
MAMKNESATEPENSDRKKKGYDLSIELLSSSEVQSPFGSAALIAGSDSRTIEANSFSVFEFEDAKDSFQNSIATVSSSAYLLLCCCGLVWKDWNGVGNFMHNLVMAWFCFLGPLAPAAQLANSGSSERTNAPIRHEAARFIQYVGLAISTYFNARRLSSRCRRYEVDNMCLTVPITTKTIICAIVCTVIPALPIYNDVPGDLFAVIIALLIIFIFFLGGNLQFMLTDAESSHQILQNLTKRLARNGSVSLVEVQVARKEIERIVDNGNAANTAIMATALINVLCVFIVSILLNAGVFGLIEVSCLVFFKEVIVAMVGLYWIASVNDESQRFVKLVGESLTTRRLLRELDVDQITDMTIILHSLQTNPIRFQITGMVITRREVAFRFSAWLFGTVLSAVSKLIKS